MAESTLTLSLTDYQQAVSEFLYGGNGTYANNTTDEQNRINRIINSGLRFFYNPPPLAGEALAHEWSFLNPIGTLTLNAAYSTGTITVVSGVCTLAGGTWPSWAASGQLMIGGIDYAVAVLTDSTHITLADTTQNFAANTPFNLHQDDYTLPDDFSAMLGELTFRPNDSSWILVDLVGESRIRELRQFRGYTGFSLNQPFLAAVQPVRMDMTLGTRNLLMWWPRVLNTGVVAFQYRVRPNQLTVTNVYPYGASDHSQTIRASILAECELEDQGGRGVRWDEFMRLLQASINLDGRNNRPVKLGYNGDNSDNTNIELGRHVLPSLPSYRGFGHV